MAITLALLPRMLERRSGTIVNVSSIGGRLGIAPEAAYCASKFALAGWSESLAADLVGTGVAVRLVLPGAIDTEIWDQPDNDTGHLRRAAGAARGGGRGDRRLHRQRPVRALHSRHERRGGDEDEGLRRVRGRHAVHGRPPPTGARSRREGPRVRGPPRQAEPGRCRPTSWSSSWPQLPFGLHHMEDAQPIHPDWVVTRPILSGVCGSDAKLVLGDFEDGDIDNPMAAFSSLPHVPGHEVVAEVVVARARRRGASMSASGWCSTRG